jgi:hypothetical protein
VHAARVLGRAAPTTGIAPFGELVEQVMTTEPYASAARVFWIPDNGASHNGARSIARMRAAWSTAELVHLPIHASWLNQVEIFFSIVQRKVIKPGDFTTSPSWAGGYWPSRTATTPPPSPSTGTSPADPSIACSTGSPSTNRWPHDPRRFNGDEH